MALYDLSDKDLKLEYIEQVDVVVLTDMFTEADNPEKVAICGEDLPEVINALTKIMESRK